MSRDNPHKINVQSKASEETSSNVNLGILETSNNETQENKTKENEIQENETGENFEFEYKQVNEKKAKTRAIRLVECFSRQQFSMIVDMEVKDLEVNTKLNEDFFKKIYNTYFVGNKYVVCSDFKYYGYSSKMDSHVIDVYIKGRYRINKITLSFNKNWAVKGFKYNSYTEPVPENNNYYTEQLIKIGEQKLNGLLTLPKTYKAGPVAILVQGIGYHNADMSVGENRIFADIAHELAKEGIATIRYNERFNQCEELAKTNNTLETEIIDDAVAAVKYVSSSTNVDKNKIFIVGHDIGGMVAPKIAEKCPEVKGIVCLGSSPRKIVDVIYDQKLLSLAEINKFKQSKENEKKDKKITDEDYKKDMKYVKEIKNTLNVDFNNIKIIRNLKTSSEKLIQGYSEVYWNSANNIDIEKVIEKIKTPMFIMQGSADVEVTENRDFIEWQRILEGRNNCKLKVYEGLNHYFMKSTGKTILDINDEYKAKGVIEQAPLKDIAKFINDKSGIKR